MAATTTKLVTATDTSWTEVTGGLGCIIQALVGAGVVVAVATTSRCGHAWYPTPTRMRQDPRRDAGAAGRRRGLGPGRRY